MPEGYPSVRAPLANRCGSLVILVRAMAVQAEIGYADGLVVKAEHFYVWAIGGNPAIRELLPLDKAGLNVVFMDAIRPFRAKKVRILNGGHRGRVYGLNLASDAHAIE